MGQYWIPVNLTKREYIDPHKLGCGLKLWEQLANPYVGQALVILLAIMPEKRGGGDLTEDSIIGHWAGDAITFAGDYSEDGDFSAPDGTPFSLIYTLCQEESEQITDPLKLAQWLADTRVSAPSTTLEHLAYFTDITDDVVRVIEREMDGKFSGNGWREFVPNN